MTCSHDWAGKLPGKAEKVTEHPGSLADGPECAVQGGALPRGLADSSCRLTTCHRCLHPAAHHWAAASLARIIIAQLLHIQAS